MALFCVQCSVAIFMIVNDTTDFVYAKHTHKGTKLVLSTPSQFHHPKSENIIETSRQMNEQRKKENSISTRVDKLCKIV